MIRCVLLCLCVPCMLDGTDHTYPNISLPFIPDLSPVPWSRSKRVVPHLELDILLRILNRMKVVMDADDPRRLALAFNASDDSVGVKQSGVGGGQASAGVGESKEDTGAYVLCCHSTSRKRTNVTDFPPFVSPSSFLLPSFLPS